MTKDELGTGMSLMEIRITCLTGTRVVPKIYETVGYDHGIGTRNKALQKNEKGSQGIDDWTRDPVKYSNPAA